MLLSEQTANKTQVFLYEHAFNEKNEENFLK